LVVGTVPIPDLAHEALEGVVRMEEHTFSGVEDLLLV
jgi:hypothetical protein